MTLKDSEGNYRFKVLVCGPDIWRNVTLLNSFLKKSKPTSEEFMDCISIRISDKIIFDICLLVGRGRFRRQRKIILQTADAIILLFSLDPKCLDKNITYVENIKSLLGEIWNTIPIAVILDANVTYPLEMENFISRLNFGRAVIVFKIDDIDSPKVKDILMTIIKLVIFRHTFPGKYEQELKSAIKGVEIF